MKNKSRYEKERVALVEHTKSELARIEAEYIPCPGLDDRLSYLRRPIWDEFYQKLAELKQKYNID